jgi:hypothetical protein
VVVLLVVVVLGGCTGSTRRVGSETGSGTRAFSTSTMRLDYPADWHIQAGEEPSGFPGPNIGADIEFILTTQSQRPHCTTTGTGYTCRTNTIGSLETSAAFVVWQWCTDCGAGPPHTTATKVGGLPARKGSSPDVECDPRLHAERDFEVIGAGPPPASVGYTVSACLRGPGVRALQARVERTLRSVRFTRAAATLAPPLPPPVPPESVPVITRSTRP